MSELERWRRLLERMVEVMDKQVERCEFAAARQKPFVETIEPAEEISGVKN